MHWVATAVGAVLVMAVFRDVFLTLWHPSRQGTLTRYTTRGVWWLLGRRRRRGRLAEQAGPLGMLAVMAVWASIVVLGWSLVYWGHMAESFSFDPGLQPGERSDFLDALYLALVTFGTLGYGDIVPSAGWLRVAAPMQALGGFALLTASVAWVLQIYPALTRRRALALRLTHLREVGAADAPAALDSSMGAALLSSLAADVELVRTDLNEYAETYYFRDSEDAASLPAIVGYAEELMRSGQKASREDVRLSAALLSCALDDFAGVISRHFVGVEGTTPEVLSAYAADHGH